MWWTRPRVARVPEPPGTPRSAEQRHLVPGPLDVRVEAQERLEVRDRRLVATCPVAEVVGLEQVPAPASRASRRRGDRSSLWRTSSLRLRGARRGTARRGRRRPCGHGGGGPARRASPSTRLPQHAARPRTYQTTSTSSSFLARIRRTRAGPTCSRSSSRSAGRPRGGATAGAGRSSTRSPAGARGPRGPRSAPVLLAALDDVVGGEQPVGVLAMLR